MKKIAIAMVSALAIALLVLAGCGGAPDTLEGTEWNVTSVSVGGVDTDVKKLAETVGIPVDSFLVTFGADGKGTSTVLGQTTNFTYTYSDGKLTTEGETFPVEGDTIVMETGGVSMTLKRK